MKGWILVMLLLFATAARAQQLAGDARRCPWFIPTHVKVQFAGGIGCISVGVGYTYAKEKLETDMYFGYVPRSMGKRLNSFSLKTTYNPMRLRLDNTLSVHPFSVGFVLNYTPGKEYFVKLPNYYPKKYYWWSSAVRPGLFVGTRLHKNFSPHHLIKSADWYWEAGTNELYAVSMAANKRFPGLKDLITLGSGVKLAFRR